MKNKIIFIFGVLIAVNAGYSEVPYSPVPNNNSGYIHNGPLMPRCTENDSPEIWSGSWEDLKAISALVRDKFPFELTKHLGRDIAELKPVSRREMEKQISNGNPQGWSSYIFDSYHEPSDVDDMLMDVLGYYMSKDVSIGTQEEKRVRAMIKFGSEINKALKFLKGKVEKFTNPNGGEVVYDKETGKIILNEKIGTKNFGESYEWIGATLQKYLKTQDWFKYTPQGQALKLEAAIMREVGKYIAPKHFPLDVEPHEKNNQYKYAGILFESDSYGRFYIIDGQTGKRMTKKQVEDFPTTFSDMWKDKGLVCVESDAIDIVPPKENRQSAQNASSKDGNDAEKGVVAKSDADEAKDSNDKGKAPESITVEAKDDGGVGVRGWCKCPNRSAHITLGNLSKMGVDPNLADYSYFICSDCYKVRKDLDGVAMLTGSSPIKIWDMSLARKHGYFGKGEPSAEALGVLTKSQERLFAIPDGRIVIPGLCKCLSPAMWLLGEAPNKIEICRNCGKPRSAIPITAKNTSRIPNKLRRCIKTRTGLFVCVCKGETALYPQMSTSIYDDGNADFSLMCTKCMQVKYTAFAPMRQFKQKFPNGPSRSEEFVAYMTGTTDLKAAIKAADDEAAKLQAIMKTSK